MTRPSVTTILSIAATGLLLAGCGSQPTPEAPKEIKNTAVQIEPFVPTTKPAETVGNDLPNAPLDAAAPVNLIYSIEVWEMLFPRNTVSTDEDFWKRVDESAVDLAAHDVLYKNGIRVGQLPISDMKYLEELVLDKKGQQTKLSGMAGNQIQLITSPEIDHQTLFYFNRENKLIGHTYDRSINLIYFSFQTTPRKPDQIRLSLTPAVKAANTKLQYTLLPGKADKEINYVSEEFHYDTNLSLDQPLSSIMVLAPSVEARDDVSLGHAYFVKNTPSEQLDRLIFIVPKAFKRKDN